MFRNLGDWRFQDVTAGSLIESKRSYQNAFADFDNDGRIDLLTGGKLYRNLSDTGNWIALALIGRAPNTAAIGACATLEHDGGKRWVRQVEAGTGSGNQSDLRLHVGLGDCAGPIKIAIRWPDGTTTRHESAPNRRLTLLQP